MENTSDLQGISATAQDYFEGMYNKDLDRLRKAFAPSAVLIGYFKGDLLNLPLDRWLTMLEDRPSPRDSGEAFEMRVVSTDVTGRVAAVKVVDLCFGMRYTDYLNMVKTDGQWKIVNKTFHHD